MNSKKVKLDVNMIKLNFKVNSVLSVYAAEKLLLKMGKSKKSTNNINSIKHGFTDFSLSPTINMP